MRLPTWISATIGQPARDHRKAGPQGDGVPEEDMAGGGHAINMQGAPLSIGGYSR